MKQYLKECEIWLKIEWCLSLIEIVAFINKKFKIKSTKMKMSIH